MAKRNKQKVAKKSTGARGKSQEDGKKGSAKPKNSNSSSLTLWVPAAIAICAVVIGGWQHFGGVDSAEVIGSSEADAGVPSPTVNKSLDSSPDPSLEIRKEAPTEVAPIKQPPPPPFEASIAAFHSPDGFNIDDASHRADLASYLQYDDGYSACLDEETAKTDRSGVRDLKRAKWSILQEWAAVRDRWSVRLPRSDFTNEGLVEMASGIASTCRLITLTHEEYSGRATAVLGEAVANGTLYEFTVEYQGPASEYRTMACLSRFMEWASKKESPPPSASEKYVRELLRNEWAVAAGKFKEDAEREEEAPRALPIGWQENRDKSGFSYYLDPKIGKTTWIRPAVPGGVGVLNEPSPAVEGNKKYASLVVRGRPCSPDNGDMKFMDDIE